MDVRIYTPEDSHELAVALLDPLGRKTGFGSRVIRIPEWVADDEVLVVHGPPLPHAPLRIVRSNKQVRFDVRGGAVEFDDAGIVAT